MIEETAEWKRGRNGEILIHSFAIENGCTAFDIGGTAHGHAPLLNSRSCNLVAPDALHIRNFPIWAEYKTKSHAFDWRGGSRDMEHVLPPCLMHGIDGRNFEDYRSANKSVPVVLWFLTINTGMLHVASLDELGDPTPSVNPAFDIVNWPLKRMFRVVTFNARRLRAWFNHPRQYDRLPNQSERKELLDWLRPVQCEFDGFVEHFLTWRESQWAHRAA